MNIQQRYILFISIMASSMAFLDGTIVNIILPVLKNNLHMQDNELQWVVEGYMVTLTALLLLSGNLNDRYGTKKIFTLGVYIFLVASLACALSINGITLIISRIVQGIGGAMMIPGSLALLGKYFDKKTESQAIAIWTSTTSAAIVVGPAVAGLLVEWWSWRTAFLINLPLGFIIMLFIRFIPADTDKKVIPQDWVGTVIVVSMFVTLITGFIGWQNQSFIHIEVYLPLLIGITLFGLFLFQESRYTHPMLPLDFFKIRTFSIINLFTLGIYTLLSAVTFLIPFRLLELANYSVFQTSLATMPLVICLFTLSPLSNRLALQYGYKIVLFSGSVLFAVSIWLLGYQISHTATFSYFTHFFPGILLMGVGFSFIVAPLTSVALNAAGKPNVGMSSAVNNTAARFAGLVGVLLASSFFLFFFKTYVTPNTHIASFTKSTTHIHLYTQGFLHAFYNAYTFFAVMALLVALLPLFLYPRKKQK